MELPDELYALIGEFMLSFPKLDDEGKRYWAKREFVQNLVVLYPEYINYIIENYKIPINDFKGRCKSFEEQCRKTADEKIKHHGLEEYRDVIMENYTLSIPKLLNIVEFCYNQTNDLDKACEIYCALGYPEFENRNGTEGYLINFMRNWVDFSTQRGCRKEYAEYLLLCSFHDIDNRDHYPIYDTKEKKGIWSFFPFTKENIDGLVDLAMRLDEFDSEECKNRIKGIYTDEIVINIDEEDAPRCSLLCNFYVYIFNKLYDTHPLSAFAVSAFYKWLQLNQSAISHYLPELPASDLSSLLMDYAEHEYANASTIYNIYNEGLPIQFPYLPGQNDDIIELLYKLHYQTEISKSELADLWVYIVVNKKLSYINQRLKETAPIMLVSEGEYAENGEFMLPWKYVRFVDGKAFFYHPNHERGKGATLPFKLEHDKIQATFMDIGKTILWNFPFIPCEAEQGRIVRIDESFAISVIWDLVNIHEKLSRWKSIPHSTSLTAQDILLQYKSQQFEFLANKQLGQFEIIPVIENVSNSVTRREEPALLFTVGANSKSCTLVYENTEISRASYIFIVERASYTKTAGKITSYFTSEQTNKRAALQYSRDMFNKNDGFMRVIRVLHDNNENWKRAINFYAKS